jgi:AraC family transcriptional regulator of adaptative response/methylated-DNA-[protein]-cysteine methyltransferase
MNDYERVAQVIRFLDERHAEQPDLAALAESGGLSPFHFHRRFTSWAAVTPKDFLQCLTLENVRSSLRAGESVLGTAIESGLSGPERLHDLCVTLEAATPGEIKSRGAGLVITYGIADTPFGRAVIGETERGICHLSFVGDESSTSARLRSDWPAAELKRDDKLAAELARDIFSREPDPTRRLRGFVRGTAFQLRVWRALLRIAPGNLVTYGRLARCIGQPSASRAVGSAVGANPLAFIVPCHRVIRETGVLGNYRWDPIRKRAMIGWEGAAQQHEVVAA